MVIGICGGSGSGKSTVARHILDALRDKIVHLQQDYYYKDLSNLPLEECAQLNFDHPDAIDLDLFEQHVRELSAGRAIECPRYDFAKYSRLQPMHLAPKPVIIVEGILIFYSESLRNLMDVKIFVDTDADLRFLRRLSRDIKERGRTVDSVIRQYLETVRPMHLQFVEPYKRYADVIIPEGGFNRVGVDLVIEKIKSKLAKAANA